MGCSRTGSSLITFINAIRSGGSAHFRTGVDKGLEIIRALRGHTTGYAHADLLALMRLAAAARFQLAPDPVMGRDGDFLLLKISKAKHLSTRTRMARSVTERLRSLKIGVTYDQRSDYLAMGHGEEETPNSTPRKPSPPCAMP